MKYLFYCIVSLTSLITCAQNQFEKTYLDSLKNETTEANHVYYRISNIGSANGIDNYLTKDYYKSGKIQFEQFYLNLSKDSLKQIHYYESGVMKDESFLFKNERTGMLTTWFDNGKIKSAVNYKKSMPDGKYDLWYKNGNKKEEGENITRIDSLTVTFREKVNNFWDKKNVQKVKDGNGFCEKEVDSLVENGMIKNGFRDGFWEGKDYIIDNITKITFCEQYAQGKLVLGTSVDSENKTYQYTSIENGIPINESTDLRRFVQRNMEVPNVDIELYGKVIAEFYIEKDGSLSKLKIVKDIGYGTGQAVKNVILKYNKPLSPVTKRGILVRQKYILPVVVHFAQE